MIVTGTQTSTVVIDLATGEDKSLFMLVSGYSRQWVNEDAGNEM